MKRVLFWTLLFFAVRCSAQVGPGYLFYVQSAPSGACSQSSPVQYVISTGAIWTCQSGTWTAIGGGGGSGTVGPNSGAAGALATYAAAAGSTTVGPDAGLTSTGTGGLTLGGVGVGTGIITAAGTTSGSVIWQCASGTCPSWTTGSPVQSTSNSGFSMKHLNQIAANNFAGSCSMVAALTCTFTINATYTNYLSFVNVDHASAPPATADAASCSLSGTTVTITAAISNSLTWDCMIMGNPN